MENKRYTAVMIFLLIAMLILTFRLIYLYLADNSRFPINTVKIVSLQKTLSHKDLDPILEKYWSYSFFSLPLGRLKTELADINFIKKVDIQRLWPDTLKINVIEKQAIACFNDRLLAEDGEVFEDEKSNL